MACVPQAVFVVTLRHSLRHQEMVVETNQFLRQAKVGMRVLAQPSISLPVPATLTLPSLTPYECSLLPL